MPSTLYFASQLFHAFRTMCSLRNITTLLPAGSPAPRLTLWVRFSNESVPHCESLEWSSSDVFTSTSNLTDFDCSDTGSSACSSIFLNQKRTHPFQNPISSEVERFHYLDPRRFSGNIISMRNTKDHCGSRYRSDDKAYKVASSENSTRTRCTRRYQCKPIRHHSTLRYPPENSDLEFHENGLDRCPPHPSGIHSATATERITQLEVELSRLRSQLAELILRQEGEIASVGSSTDANTRADADGESDECNVRSLVDPLTESKKTNPVPPFSKENSDNIAIPIPPPPPFSLFSSTPTSKPTSNDWRARLVEKKKGNSETSSCSATVVKSSPGGMQNVLRELQSGGVKLRSVPRSPGGTPIRVQRASPSTALDPSSIISRALRTKLRHMRAALNASCSEDGNSAQNSNLDFSAESIPPPVQSVVLSENIPPQ